MQTNLQKALDTTDGKILILSNKFKCDHESKNIVNDLLNALQNFTLDPVFEQYGWFGCWDSSTYFNSPWFGKPLFFGNFCDCSHVFNIVVDDDELATQLKTAIKQNLNSPDYRSKSDQMYESFSVLKRRFEEDQFRLVNSSVYQLIESGSHVRLNSWQKECADFEYIGRRTSIDYLL